MRYWTHLFYNELEFCFVCVVFSTNVISLPQAHGAHSDFVACPAFLFWSCAVGPQLLSHTTSCGNISYGELTTMLSAHNKAKSFKIWRSAEFGKTSKDTQRDACALTILLGFTRAANVLHPIQFHKSGTSLCKPIRYS